jgi:hypothetical protein
MGPTLVESVGSRNFVSLMYTWWAEALLLAGQQEEAARRIGRAMELARLCDEAGYLTEALHGHARILGAAETLDVDSAVAAFHRASQQAQRLGQRSVLARCQLGLAQLYQRANRPADAHAHFVTAVSQLREMGLGLWLREAEAGLTAA